MDKGNRLIDKELDIERFIKAQKKLRIIIRTLFTKVERILISNNKEFVLTMSSDADISNPYNGS